MQQTHKLIYLAFVIHILISLITGMQEEVLFFIMLIPLAANLVGLYFLSFTDKIKLGANIFMISSFLYIPIGIIGIIGCRKVLDSVIEKDFFKTTTNE